MWVMHSQSERGRDSIGMNSLFFRSSRVIANKVSNRIEGS